MLEKMQQPLLFWSTQMHVSISESSSNLKKLNGPRTSLMGITELFEENTRDKNSRETIPLSFEFKSELVSIGKFWILICFWLKFFLQCYINLYHGIP